MQVNSINSSNQNFGMRLRASQDFWKTVETGLSTKESKECIKNLKRINMRASIKDVYDIHPINEKYTQKSFGSVFFGKTENFVKKGFELLNDAKKQVFEYVETGDAKEGVDGVKENEFLKYIADNLGFVERFERASDKEKAAQRELQARVASCVNSVKVD